MGIAHVVGWRNAQSGAFESRDINSNGDIEAAMEDFLANKIMAGEVSTASCFNNFHGQCAYAHVIVVSPYIPPDIALLYNGNRVTVLHCSDSTAIDKAHAIAFSVSNYQHDLYDMEL